MNYYVFSPLKNKGDGCPLFFTPGLLYKQLDMKRFIDFQRIFRQFGVFSYVDIRQAEPGFDRRRLHEWRDKGYSKKIIKGYYIFSDFELNEQALFEIANRIYSPSYVSFEMTPAYYGLIPESIYGVTSASTRKTASFKTPIGEFSYRTISRKLYFGFEFIKTNGRMCKIASPEKAFLDFFYLRPDVREAGHFAELRINRGVFLRKVNRGKVNEKKRGRFYFLGRPAKEKK